MNLLNIFLSFIKIGALAFGGAYAAIPLVEKEVVTNLHWMTYDEFSNLLAIDEATPGPIIVNAASFIGMKVGGVPGAIVATLGSIIPAFIIATILIIVYNKYHKLSWLQSIIASLKCMAIALIFSTFISIAINTIFIESNISFESINIIGLILIGISFFLINKKKISPILVMLGCGLVNVIISLIL